MGRTERTRGCDRRVHFARRANTICGSRCFIFASGVDSHSYSYRPQWGTSGGHKDEYHWPLQVMVVKILSARREVLAERRLVIQ